MGKGKGAKNEAAIISQHTESDFSFIHKEKSIQEKLRFSKNQFFFECQDINFS